MEKIAVKIGRVEPILTEPRSFVVRFMTEIGMVQSPKMTLREAVELRLFASLEGVNGMIYMKP